MKRTILLLTAVFIAQIIYSQNDFRKAYVVKLNRDTIFGFAGFSEGLKNYQYCQFKESQDGNKITYNPSEIFGYGFVDDKYFETKAIENNDKSSSPVMLEVLVKGLVSLYQYDKIFYIDKADTGLIKLSNETIESSVNGTKTSTLSTKYIGILSLYLSDCDEIRSSIQNVKFSEKSLVDLIVKYNGYKNSTVKIYREKTPWVHLRAGMLTGMAIASIGFDTEGDENFLYLNTPFEKSISPLFGVSLEVLFPRLAENFSIQTDFIFYKSNFYSYNKEVSISQKTNRDYISIGLSQLKIPFGLKYTFSSGNFKPFVLLGVSTTLFLDSETDWTREVESISVEPNAQVPRHTIKLYKNEALPVKSSQLGMWGGAGIIKSIGKNINLFVECRFEKTNGIAAPTPFYVLKSTSSDILFNIGLKTK
jgi:hypothetical protein